MTYLKYYASRNSVTSYRDNAMAPSLWKVAIKMNGLSKSALLALAIILFAAPNCDAQTKKVWTRDNIHEWIDSNSQKQAKRQLVLHATVKDRKQYDSPDWFYPPQMYITSSRQGQLGRLVLPAYKVINVLDKERVVLEVVDKPGRRYLAVFDLGDTSRIRVDHAPHISPDRLSLMLFERVENYNYKNSKNILKTLPVFKKLEPADVMK